MNGGTIPSYLSVKHLLHVRWLHLLHRSLVSLVSPQMWHGGVVAGTGVKTSVAGRLNDICSWFVSSSMPSDVVIIRDVLT